MMMNINENTNWRKWTTANNSAVVGVLHQQHKMNNVVGTPTHNFYTSIPTTAWEISVQYTKYDIYIEYRSLKYVRDRHMLETNKRKTKDSLNNIKINNSRKSIWVSNLFFMHPSVLFLTLLIKKLRHDNWIRRVSVNNFWNG